MNIPKAQDNLKSIDKARKHFSNYTSKRVKYKDANGKDQHRLAFPGEMAREHSSVETEDYQFTGPSKQFDEFGIGISLYFATVKALFVIVSLCAVISITAIITNKSFNNRHDFNTPAYAGNRTCPTWLLGSTFGAARDDLKLLRQGASDIAVVCIFTLFLLFAVWAERYVVARIDVSKQTTQDYAVMINNAPHDILSPEVYYNHFKYFGDIVYITVSVRNGELIQCLADQQVLEERLQGVTFRDSWKSCFPYFFPPKPDLETELETLKAKIENMCHVSRPRFKAYKVFIIFNTEQAKRHCIESCAVSAFDLMRKQSSNSSAMLNGNLLDVREPHEPNDFMFETTHTSWRKRASTWLGSYFLCFSLLVVNFFIVLILEDGFYVALFLTLSNSILPTFISACTKYVEIHQMHSNKEGSMLLKLFVMRCINSAVLIYLAYPFEKQFSSQYLRAVQGILFTDAWLTPLLRGLDVFGLIDRYIIGPILSNSQIELEDYWRGTEWTLADRYTDVLKSIFVALFFLVPLPSGLFIVAFGMIVTYFVDKYCLFNIWRCPPALDSTMSMMARVGLGLSVFAHICTARDFFINWPFADESLEKRCNFLSCPGDQYMTDDQKTLSKLYSGASAAYFAICMLWIFFYAPLVHFFNSLSTHRTHVGQAMDIPFRSVSGLSPYIPLTNRDQLEDTILCADVSCLPFDAVPVNVFDKDADEVPQDLSVADARVLKFLVNDTDKKYRPLNELFGEVAYFDEQGQLVTSRRLRSVFYESGPSDVAPEDSNNNSFDPFISVSMSEIEYTVSISLKETVQEKLNCR